MEIPTQPPRVSVRHAGAWPGQVEARARLFAEWVRSGHSPDCRGFPGSCAKCGLGAFCDEVEAFVRDGALPPLQDPPCLAGSHEQRPLKPAASPAQLLQFVMRHRIFVKTAPCAGCGYDAACAGLPISESLRRERTRPR